MSGWHQSNKKRSRRAALAATYEPSFAGACLRVVDAGFCGIIFIAPLFFGGRHDLGRFVFVTLAAVIALAWCCRQVALGGGKWTRTIAYTIVFAAAALLVLQLLPLRGQWIDYLSPRTMALLPLWTNNPVGGPAGGMRLGTWQTLTLTPDSTRIALAMLLGYGLLFVTAVQRLRELADIERMLNWIALSAIGMSILALIQYFTSNGLFFWFYEYPYLSNNQYVHGSFTNRNHFAHFLILGTGPLIAWIIRRQQGDVSQESSRSVRLPHASMVSAGLAVALLIVVVAALLSLSRGGAISMAVALITAMVLLYRKGLTTSRTFFAAGAAIVITIGILSLHGYEKLSSRLDDLTVGSLEEVDAKSGRRKIWAANAAAIQAGGFFGSGAGSHRDIYRVYLQEPYSKEYTHAENGYLQIVSENGFLGGLLLFCTLGICGTACARVLCARTSSQMAICAAAVTASLAASVVHSIVDFVWFIPACMSVTLLLVACAINLSHLSRPSGASHQRQPVPLTRLRWVELSFAVFLIGGWMVSVLFGPGMASIHNDRYLRASIASRNSLQRQIATNSDTDTENSSTQEMYLAEMLSQLQEAVRWHPQSARIHARLANRHLQQFELLQQRSGNAMTTTQIRDAAMASGFATPKELREWLSRAFAQNISHLYRAYFHARQAIKLNPLQGEVYLYLAELCFLEGRTPDAIDAYLNQSLRVRPQDCDILLEVGKQHLLLGNIEQASDYWSRAFRSKGPHQWRIIQYMAGQIAAAEFIEIFQPDWQTLNRLWNRYRKFGQPEDLQVLMQYAASTAETGCQGESDSRKVTIWFTLAAMQSFLDENDNAIVSLRRAYEIDPSRYLVRRALGHALLKAEQYQSAEKQFRWCLARRPNDKSNQVLLVRAVKGSVARSNPGLSPQKTIK